jgi:hypothetical protein
MINAARGATIAGLTGATYAALDRGTAAERLTAASDASRDPATLALGAAGGALATPRMTKPSAEKAPAMEQIAAEKKAAYDAVDAAGIRYTPDAVTDLVDGIKSELEAAHVSAIRHPKAWSMLTDEILGIAGQPQSMTELDQLRQVIRRDVASSNDPAEAFMGQKMIKNIDEFMDRAGPAQIEQGAPAYAGGAGSIVDPQAATAILRKARNLNTRLVKLRELDTLDEAAADRAAVTGSGGNRENAERQNVLRFKTRMHNLTPAEAAATQRVIDGTMTGNALRQVGKLSPGGNGLMLAGHLVAGPATGGKSLVVAAAGAASKAVSEALTRRNVQALREIIARDGEAAAEVSRQIADPQYAELRAQLANDLAVQSGVQGSSAAAERRERAASRR